MRRRSEDARIFAEQVKAQYDEGTYTYSALARLHKCSVNYIRNIVLGNKVVRKDPPEGRRKRMIVYGVAFYVYSDGRIWSCATNQFKTFPSTGYRNFHVLVDGVQRTVLSHRLVLTAFCRKPKKGEVGRHLDDNPQNDDISNLAWGSHQDNTDDKVRNDRHVYGARSVHAKLTDSLVLILRKNFDQDCMNAGTYIDDFIYKHGLDISVVNASCALYSDSWKHLPDFGIKRLTKQERLFAPKKLKAEPTLFERKLDEKEARLVHKNFIKYGHKYETRRAFTKAYASYLERSKNIIVSYSSIDNVVVGRTFGHIYEEFN